MRRRKRGEGKRKREEKGERRGRRQREGVRCHN
jgi:hypothetical protein